MPINQTQAEAQHDSKTKKLQEITAALAQDTEKRAPLVLVERSTTSPDLSRVSP